MVREKLADLKEKDYVRLLQPCIDGNEIMEMFHLPPCREVGILKQTLKEAVLDNSVENEREPLMALLMKKAEEMGLKTSWKSVQDRDFLLNIMAGMGLYSDFSIYLHFENQNDR